MRASRAVALGAVASLAATAAPAAAEVLSGTVDVDTVLAPGRLAPSARHPRPAWIDLHLGWAPESRQDFTLKQATFRIPRGVRYRGGKLPACRLELLSSGSAAGCPKGSKVGSGVVKAVLGTTPTTAKVTVYNGGAKQVLFFFAMDGPVRIRQPIVGRVTPLRGSWSFELALDVPPSLQVVGGVPLFLKDVKLKAGRGTGWLRATAWPETIGFEITVGPPSAG